MRPVPQVAIAVVLGVAVWAPASLGQAGRAGAVAGPPRVVELRIGGEINPVVSEFVNGALDSAAREGASLILITMDTPGGLSDSMREIMQKILASPVPVAVYVSPSGARAASAGFFILLTADIAAMAPGTNAGASTPVFGPIGEKIDEVLKRKATSDAAAYMRSIVTQRGRNVALAEKAVTESKAYSEREALEGRLIDLVAPSVDELLAALDGRTVRRFDGSAAKLSLKNPVRVAAEMNQRQRLLAFIAKPDILFLLFIIGLLGIYVEFSHPGLVLPGVVGVLSLVVALVAMRILPVNVIGVLLLLLAIGLFVLEAKVTSYGLLGLAGVVAMVIGALVLVRSPLTGFGVSLGTALAVTVPFALLAIFLMMLILRSFRWKYAVGVESLVGQEGEVTREVDGQAQVFVSGEIWRAVAPQKLAPGTRVRVVKVDGLTLHVEPAGPATPSQNPTRET